MSTKKKKNNKKKVTKTTTTTTTTVTTTTSVDKNLDTHYLLVLDRSGSMRGCWDSTIEGLNEQLGTIRGLEEEFPEQKYFITLVAFDNNIETILENAPIGEVKDFDGTEFPPRGMTSLHDAMGISINNLKNQLQKADKESESITTALVVIMTDGGENDSKEYRGPEGMNKIKTMIDELEETGAWSFNFMGANQDAVLTASGFGIGAGNSITYSSTAAGAHVAGQTLTRALKSRASLSNVSYTASLASTGTATLDSMNLSNTTFLSEVVDGNTIGEDDSNIKDEDNSED